MSEKYIKNYDAVLLMYSVLKRLGSGSVESFEDRLRSQKIQYFAQLFGVSPVYNYSLYLRGPYSTALANDLFQLKADKVSVSAEKFIPEELEENFFKLKEFINKAKEIRFLELVSTLHLMKKTKLSDQDCIKKLKEWKKADDKEIEKTFNLYSELCSN
jgi:uncharacterized protein YwgA